MSKKRKPQPRMKRTTCRRRECRRVFRQPEHRQDIYCSDYCARVAVREASREESI